MNKRIDELKMQCWETRQYGPLWFNADKFAKLIVKECCQHLTNKGYDVAREYVEKHLGVE